METIVLNTLPNPRVAKRLMGAVETGRSFVNGVEVFHLSKTKARKLAYRWRGNRRGERIAQWLARTTLPSIVKLEAPAEYRIK